MVSFAKAQNTGLHAVADADARSTRVLGSINPLDRTLTFELITVSQINDYTRAETLSGRLLKVEWLLADRGRDANRFRDALADKGIKLCILAEIARQVCQA